MDNKTPEDNITIEEDVSITTPPQTKENVIIDILKTPEELPTEPVKKVCKKKVDGRTLSSKKNILLARAAKQRKYEEQQQRMKALFGEDSDTDSDASTEESSEEETIVPKKYKKKSRERREIEELR